MMFLKKIWWFIVWLLAILCILYLGIQGYQQISQAGTALELVKLHSERFLFVAFVLCMLILASGIVLMTVSQNLLRGLDRIIDLARHGSDSTDEALKKIGPVGERVRRLHAQLSDLNDKKSLLISSLFRINTFLLNNLEAALLIVDAAGTIIGVSRRFVEKYQDKEKAPVGQHIHEILKEIDYATLLNRIRRDHGPVDLAPKQNYAFYPIFNRDGNVSHVLCIIGGEKIFTTAPELSAGKERSNRGLLPGLKRVVPRRRKKS